MERQKKEWEKFNLKGSFSSYKTHPPTKILLLPRKTQQTKTITKQPNKTKTRPKVTILNQPIKNWKITPKMPKPIKLRQNWNKNHKCYLPVTNCCRTVNRHFIWQNLSDQKCDISPSTATLEGVVDCEKVTPQPSLLQSQQGKRSQPLLTSLVLKKITVSWKKRVLSCLAIQCREI